MIISKSHKLRRAFSSNLSGWQMDVPAEQSLYIRFSDEDATDLESEVFVTTIGLEIMIDFDKGKKVHGIEITLILACHYLLRPKDRKTKRE